MDTVGRYLRHRELEELAWREDIDRFNERTVESKRATPIALLLDDFEKTHVDLVRFVKDIEAEALVVPEVETRIRVDTYEHYAEHTGSIRQWLEGGRR